MLKWRLHTHFEILRGIPTRIDVTPNGGGEHDERAVLETVIEGDRLYVADRGYAKFTLFNKIVDAKSSYVCRLRDNSVWETTEEKYRHDNAPLNEIISDEIVCFPNSAASNRPDHKVRVICVRINPHTTRGKSRGGSSGVDSDGILRIATNLLDVPAETIALIFSERWAIEIFFRFFKHILGCRHLLNHDQNGAEALVKLLASRPLAPADIIAEIRDWRSVSDRVRRHAIELAKELPPITAPSKLGDASWRTVVNPFLSPHLYRFAERQAEAACKLDGGNPELLRTLGLARYRCGKYEEAVTTLLEASHSRARPVDSVYLAMSYYHLGDQEAAEERLAQLREMMSTDKWSKNSNAQPALLEVIAVLKGQPVPIAGRQRSEIDSRIDRIRKAKVLTLAGQNSGHVEGRMLWTGQEHFYRFVTNAGGAIQVRVQPDRDLRTYVFLYADRDSNNDGYLDGLDSHEVGAKGHPARVFSSPVRAGQTYYVEVRSMNDPGTGTYKLTVAPQDVD